MTQKQIKIGILSILLVVPVLIFLFIKVFGTNQYDLPYYGPKKLGQQGDTIYYQVPSSVLKSIEEPNKKKISKPILLPYKVKDDLHDNVMARLNEKSPGFEILSMSGIALNKSSSDDALFLKQLKANHYYLLDNRGYIRGIYQADQLQDIDNLIIEILILKQIHRRNYKSNS